MQSMAGTGSAQFQVGANAGNTVTVNFKEIDLTGGTGDAGLDGLSTALGTFNTTQNVSNSQALVTAPSKGTVISVLAHAGELVSTQPLVQIANLSTLECLAEVDVADLPRLQGKQEALISCRAFRGPEERCAVFTGPGLLLSIQADQR